ncbi:MAG: vanadium nitrogenase [Lachnospiraceae bacterium]|nr:vanadium nitrogenase [Lachnospiraceae bacterium]
MQNIIVFSNSFLSYLLLMIIIVVVAALGFTVGRILRNRKDAKSVQEVSSEAVTSGSDN